MSRYHDAVAAYGLVVLIVRHVDVLVGNGDLISAGRKFKRAGVRPLSMAAKVAGCPGSGGQVQHERAPRAGNSQLAPVVHRQAGHGRGAAFRNGKGIIDGRHEDICPDGRLGEVAGCFIDDAIARGFAGIGWIVVHGVDKRSVVLRFGTERAGLGSRRGSHVRSGVEVRLRKFIPAMGGTVVLMALQEHCCLDGVMAHHAPECIPSPVPPPWRQKSGGEERLRASRKILGKTSARSARESKRARGCHARD